MKKKIYQLFEGIVLPEDITRITGNEAIYQFRCGEWLLQIKTFSVEGHSKILHRWCNQPYSARFWAMPGSLEELKAYYHKMVKTFEHAPVMLFCNGQPVGFADLYPVWKDILIKYYKASPNEYGVHFLIAPYKEIFQMFKQVPKDFSEVLLWAVLRYLFVQVGVEKVLAEPDHLNTNACRLAERVGFRFLKYIELPEKKASLYIHDKTAFKYQ
ncbi:GNAT family N-acetyltransferase [Niabella insulamsoli]|uniref:GNAT family N-acetyltransferase n=1 Tax=Niabella insulamsoli TaxID=3144874 RepID=UPI0031FE1F85